MRGYGGDWGNQFSPPPLLASSTVHTSGLLFSPFVQEGIPLILHVFLHCSLPDSCCYLFHM